MKIQTMPKQVLAQVLHYIADYERLEGLNHVADGDISQEDVRGALRELAVHLNDQAEGEAEVSNAALSNEFLSKQTKKLLSSLSPRDEKRLLKAFGFFDL